MKIVASNSLTVSNVNDGKDGPKGDTGSILGENMWIGYKYSYPGSTRIYPSFGHIQGITPIATQIFNDSTRFTFSDDYYIAHFQSNLFVITDKQITTTITHDDDLTIYCNDEVVVSKNSTIFTAYDITFNLKAGWNKIDILLHEISGGDQVTFGTKLSSLVEHLSYIKGADGKTPYLHTAYSWSADGMDGFTTVYPNLNLLVKTNQGVVNWGWALSGGDTSVEEVNVDGIRAVKLIKGTTTANTGWNYIRYDGLLRNLIQPSTQYVLSFDVKPSVDVSFIATLTRGDSLGQLTDDVTMNKASANQWTKVSCVLTSKETLPDDLSQIVYLRGMSTANGNWLIIKNIKLEQGSITTPHMPSASEVTTADYPRYIGQYTDFTQADSTNPSDYTWGLFKGQDSNAYTAYSWSSDGVDRFSTVYPRLNLLDNTTFKNYRLGTWTSDGTGEKYFSAVIKNGGVNNKPYVSMSNNNPTRNSNIYADPISWSFKKEYFKPSTTYTFSFYLRGNGTFRTHVYPSLIDTSSANALADGKVITPAGDGSYDWNLTSEWVRHTYTFITRSSIIENQNFLFRIFAGNSADVCLPKVEEGSIATPWMPSQSEAQSQWQDAIPMYVGVGDKDSQNPSDYRWQLNPRYVQASSDSGLSNKAGLDDLASVTETANDALVQAQNAVSNEDYTSWLEHDYQTTIDNLHAVSTQNQKDINNVDDRTTIVEGFYDRMKVKWNFINESFTFSEEGMFISNAQSKMAIQVTSDKIVFWDNNVDVAFITGEVLNIQKGVFLESATIGNHLITKFSNESPVTIIRYVGGIT